MTLTVHRSIDWARADRPPSRRAATVAGGIAVGSVALAAIVPDRVVVRWGLAAVLGGLLLWLCLESFDAGVVATLAWLLAIGLTRRMVSEIQADPARDPLLLVGPVAAAALCARSFAPPGAGRRLRVLAVSVLVFSVLVLVEVVNLRRIPLFGSVAGLIVWLVPMLWFWIGRVAGDRLARTVVAVFAGGATLAAIYGIAQSVWDFPPWDERWIATRGYAALYIGPDTVRPFGPFASASEFAIVCAIGGVLTFVVWSSPRLISVEARTRLGAASSLTPVVVVGLLGFATFGVALLLSGVRTTLLLLVVALPIVHLVARGWRGLRVIVPAMMIVAVLLAALATVDPDSLGRDGAEAALRRITVAVNDPLVSNRENTDNTLQLHWDNFRAGVEEGFERPLGSGTGATGRAGSQFGGRTVSTDTDISDAGIAFGVPGLILTAWIVLVTLVFAVRRAWRWRSYETVVLVGILVVSLRSWWAGGHYAAAPLLWFLVGRLDAPRRRVDQVVAAT